MKAHILIVEDEAVLYGRLRHFLIKENYSIDEFCDTYEDAIQFINIRKPDVVLLDINIRGEKTGLDLGKTLYENYKIPFIYVTGSNDDETFYAGLQTRHEHYFVKTKPNLDLKELLRVIQTILIKNKKNNPIISKVGVLGLVEYKKDIQQEKDLLLNCVTILYEEIICFSNAKIDDAKVETDLINLKENYLWVKVKSKSTKQPYELYLLESSLDKLIKLLPSSFSRVNQNYIVNLNPIHFKGRVNGSYIRVDNQDYVVTRTYKNELETKISQMFIDI